MKAGLWIWGAVATALLAVATLGQAGAAGRARVSTLAAVQADAQGDEGFGRLLAARIVGENGLWDNDAAQRYVNLVGRAVSLFSPQPDTAFVFGILDSPRIDAFALPGGWIFVTKGAVAAMRDEAELAAVLGHEIAHVVDRHLEQAMGGFGGRRGRAGAVVGLIGGATGSLRQAGDLLVERALEVVTRSGYGLEAELQADADGQVLAALAGYRPRALAAFLSRTGSLEAASAGHGRHPDVGRRIQRLNQLAASDSGGRRMQRRYHEQMLSKLEGGVFPFAGDGPSR